MPADYSVTTINKLLKVLQDDREATDLILNDFPTFGMIKKVNDFVGENFQFALSGAGGQGISPDFASAIANSSASNDLKPVVYRAQMYGYATVTREAMLAADGKKGGYTDLAKKIKKDLDRGFKRGVAGLLFGDGGGAFGRLDVTTTLASTTLKLRDPNSVVFFEKGMRIELSGTNGTTGAVRAGTVLTIMSVDRDLGWLTVDINISTAIATASVNDWVFVAGYHANSYGQRVMMGIPSWVPRIAPTVGEVFNGIDRSVDPFRFAGIRYLGGGASIKQAILLGLTKAGREGANPRTIGLNPMDLGAFADSLDNKADTVRLEASGAKIGYNAISIVSPTQQGNISIYGDASIPVGEAWALDFADWEIKTLTQTGKIPEIIQMPGEGGYLERIPTRDAYAIREGGFLNLICRNPANQVFIKLPTAPLAMAENQYGRLQTPAQELVSIPGSYVPTVGGPTFVVGAGFTLARTGVGLYRATFRERFPRFLAFSSGFALATLAARTVVLKTIIVGMTATNTIDMQTIDGAGAAVDVTGAAGDFAFFNFMFQNTSTPSL